MEENIEKNTEIFYNRLRICKRFPINQVVKISFPQEEKEYQFYSIGVVVGYMVLDKDIDDLKAGDFVLKIESDIKQKFTVVNPDFCFPINEEHYPTPLTENNSKNDYIKQRLSISDEVHKENLNIVKEFKIGSIVEISFNINILDKIDSEDRNILGKIKGYLHNFENDQKPGLLDLQVELFPMFNGLYAYADKQVLNISTNLCKLI